MQNGRVTRRLPALTTAAVLGLGLLAGCAGGGEDAGETPSPGVSGTPTQVGTSAGEESSESAEPYLPVPEGVELTPPGSELELGTSAVVAWRPRQDVVGVLDINVTRIERTSFKESFGGWDVRAEVKKQLAPYFVRATVENVGETNLSDRLTPLYVVDSENTLVEPTKFTEEFKPCPGGNLPKGFSGGDRTEICMVYLIGEKLDLAGVSFRPTEDFDAITWSGEISRIEKDRPKGRKRG